MSTTIPERKVDKSAWKTTLVLVDRGNFSVLTALPRSELLIIGLNVATRLALFIVRRLDTIYNVTMTNLVFSLER